MREMKYTLTEYHQYVQAAVPTVKYISLLKQKIMTQQHKLNTVIKLNGWGREKLMAMQTAYKKENNL